jgi:hypothetical protein
VIPGWVKVTHGYCRAKLEEGPLGRMHIPKWNRMAAPHVVEDGWNGGWLTLDGSPEARPFPDELVKGARFPTAEAALVAAEVELANRKG